VGSIDEPGSDFFYGRMDMQWGFPARGAMIGDLACFVGHDVASSRLICLFGSRQHVLGEGPTREVKSFSTPPRIAAALRQLIEAPDSSDGHDRRNVMDVVRRVLDPDRGFLSAEPKQHLEFLAVSLAEAVVGSWDPLDVVIGTPLYVAKG
jgi:hypothetical protein